MKPFLITVLTILLSISISAQSDTTAATQQEQAKKEKKEQKRKDEFKVYAGLSLNNLLVSSDEFKSNLGIGWMLGGAYKRGKFFYWEVGLRYHNVGYDLTPEIDSAARKTANVDGSFQLSNIDVPMTVGINFLSFVSRIAGLRLFLGVTPEFTLGVRGDEQDVLKDNINTFNVLGHGGIGVDVAFLYLEVGAGYGFSDVIKEDVQSNPFQVNFMLGFRF
jgi:hypothetical protein